MRRESISSLRVLVVHPEAHQGKCVSTMLASVGYEPTWLNPLCAPHRLPEHQHYPVIVVPLPLETAGECCEDPLALTRQLRKDSPSSQIVALVEPTVDLSTCCQAVSLGICGFVEVVDGQVSDKLVERVHQAAHRHESALREGREVHTRQIFDQTGFAGQSRIMADLLIRARRAAGVSDAPVLVQGESGTGKQLLAEAIHRLDPKRRDKPFLSINCASIVGTLAESELFGHTRGAFTGATRERLGLFRAARGGVVLLDEISDLPRELQPKLLRVLQANAVLPVGADREEPVDVRVIAATNRSLEALVASGEFRLDLYQRLNVIRLELPALRQHPEDIPLLFRFFLDKYRSYYPHPIEHVDTRVYEALEQGLGNGNVRELENLVRHVLATKEAGADIGLDDLPPSFLRENMSRPAAADDLSPLMTGVVLKLLERGRIPLAQMLDACEKLILEEVLTSTAGTNSALARRLGITRRTFYNKLHKYGLADRVRRPDSSGARDAQ